MSLKLTLHTQPAVPLEAEAISPDKVMSLRAAGIEKLTLFHGNEQAMLGDFFKVEGDGAPVIQLEGDLHQVKHIGAGMTVGEVHITGNIGAHLGAAMSGGEIIVDGDAGDWVGAEMRGGRITIKGNAGHLVGCAYRGSAIGMLGGEILVHGNVRNETGNGMRNGLIAVGGSSGDFTGVNMLAGTIVVLGEMGTRNGAGMKRGTILSMQPVEILPTFTYSCSYHPTFLRFYLQHIKDAGLPVTTAQIIGQYDRWCGDAVELNRGEILLFKA